MTSIDRLVALRQTRAIFVFGLLAVVGCGGNSDSFERLPVDGTITLDGTPLKSGRVTFIAQDKGGSSSVEITDGAFRLRGEDGLSPGPYRVEVYSLQPTGKKVANPDEPGAFVDETKNLVPGKYNVQSDLKADIPQGGPKEPLTFALTSEPVKRTKR